MFLEPCDEYSVINVVVYRCILLEHGLYYRKNNSGLSTIPLLNNTMFPMGMGTDWTIQRELNIYTFTLFKWNNVGYRFKLTSKQNNSFREYLSNCCEYMLGHGKSI